MSSRMLVTRVCATPFIPLFMSMLVKRSKTGSIFGGRALGEYPLG
jgi:hypothetical protein